MSEYYAYGFVNKELDGAVRAIQFGHACIGMMQLMSQTDEECPFHEVPNIVLFGVQGERGIVETAQLLRREVDSVKFHLWYEPDHDLGYTALCTVPIRGIIREAFSGFEKLQPIG